MKSGERRPHARAGGLSGLRRDARRRALASVLALALDRAPLTQQLTAPVTRQRHT
jgi:hypothetical protein